jgi:hypothetical protein
MLIEVVGSSTAAVCKYFSFFSKESRSILRGFVCVLDHSVQINYTLGIEHTVIFIMLIYELAIIEL